MIDINNLPAAADLSDAELADTIGRLSTFADTIDEKLKAYKDAAKIRIGGAGSISGNSYDIVVRTDVAWTLNTKLLKDQYGDAWYTKHSKQGVRVTLNVKPAKALASA